MRIYQIGPVTIKFKQTERKISEEDLKMRKNYAKMVLIILTSEGKQLQLDIYLKKHHIGTKDRLISGER